MHIDSEFIKLPLQFDADRLVEEISVFPESDWHAHPQGYAGNTALILISVDGGMNNHYHGRMQETAILKQCPYLRQVLDTFNTVFGRTRLMRLAAGREVTRHSDIDYYWHDRVRIHVPVITDPAVRFICNNREIHMAAGEAWVFDNWLEHNVINDSAIDRIHLVADTTGTSAFWRMVREGTSADAMASRKNPGARFVPYTPGRQPDLRIEQVNGSVVMQPGELDLLMRELLEDIDTPDIPLQASADAARDLVTAFRHDWRSLWSLYGESSAGWPRYRTLIRDTQAQAATVGNDLLLNSNKTTFSRVLRSRLDSALNTHLARNDAHTAGATPGATALAALAASSMATFDRPVFIVAAPRSGSTMLFELLKMNLAFWTVGDETHQAFESIPHFNPASHGYDSNRLTGTDADPAAVTRLMQHLQQRLCNADGTNIRDLPEDKRPQAVRFLEKTPKNALRIPLLHAIFPDALFIFLHRQPRQNIASIIDAWQSGRFVTYPGLPGWRGPPWSLLLPPGWRELNGRPLEEIAAHQWQVANSMILNDLSAIPAAQQTRVRYEDLLSDRHATLQQICQFADIPFGPRMQALASGTLPLSRYTLSPPDPDKWRQHEAAIERIMPGLEDLAKQLAAIENLS